VFFAENRAREAGSRAPASFTFRSLERYRCVFAGEIRRRGIWHRAGNWRNSMLTLSLTVLGALLFLLGARLLVLSWRTRQVPELLVGLFFVLLGPAGALRIMIEGHQIANERRVAAFAELFVIAGMSMVCVFTYFTFRRGVPWARAVTVLGVVALAISYYLEVDGVRFLAELEPRLTVTLPRAVVLGWSTWESLRCYLMMRRRLRFGLADPVVTNRFLLYALWTLSLAIFPSLRAVIRILELAHVQLEVRLMLQMLGLGIGLAMFVAIFLTFWPPGSYVRWLLRGQAGEAK
jgi:hypothetical protein